MNRPIDLYSLDALSDNRLIRQLESLRGRERKVLAAVLRHLTEMERRRLYLPRGYSSLFEFCTHHLKYSRSAAGRRIAAARTVARFPVLEKSLLGGVVNLYTISLISGIVTEDNFSEVMAGVRNRPTREVEAFTAAYRPARVLKDRVRPICVMVPDPPGGREVSGSSTVHAGAGRQAAPGGSPDAWREGSGRQAAAPGAGSDAPATRNGISSPASGTGSASTPRGARNPSSSPGEKGFAEADGNSPGSGGEHPERVRMQRMYRFQFAADSGFMKKVERMRALLSTKYPRGISFEEMFLLLMDEYIERHSPEGRAARRRNRRKKEQRRDGAGGGSGDPASSAVGRTGSGNKISGKRTRNIPARVRDMVFLRDGGRCTFTGTNGRRCNSTWDLQIDHIIPFALGGDDSPGNLRLLCGKHNRLEAERRFGKRQPDGNGRQE